MKPLSSFVLLALTASIACADEAGKLLVKTCDLFSLAQPGFGVPYRGTIRNDDYRLIVTIPKGLTGWGAAPEAPFHGFTVFLHGDDRRSSCFGLEIHLRVDLGEADELKKPVSGKSVKIDNTIGTREEATGVINGTELTNVRIRFSVLHDNTVNDGYVWLVTPTKDIRRNMPIFDRFVSGVKFE